MVIVLFDVKLKNTTSAARNAELVAHLQESLANTPGFIKSESFVKDGDPLHMMDISYWEDEAAVTAWRSHSEHRMAQKEGKDGLFSEYVITVADVIRRYGK